MRLKNNFKSGQFPLTLPSPRWGEGSPLTLILSPWGRGQGEGIKGQAPLETIGQLVRRKRFLTGQAPLETIGQLVRRKRFLTGQATFEYFVLFVLLGFFCLFSLSRQQNIKNSVQRSAQDIFQRGVVEIVKMR